MTHAFKFLTDEHPLVVLPVLAAKLQPVLRTRASDGAIFLQQLHYWITKGQGKLIDGGRWIYNTYNQWRQQLPWLTEWDFRTVTFNLRELGLLKFAQMGDHGRDRTGYYTINYEHEWLKPSLQSICVDVSDAAEQKPPSASETVLESKTETSTDSSPETTDNRSAANSALSVKKDPPPQRRAPQFGQPLSTGEEPAVNGQDNSFAPDVEAICAAVEGAGIQLNRQLKAVVLAYTLEEIRSALAHYRTVVREKGKRQNPPGWLTECLRGRWWKTANTGVPDEYPEGFLEAYQRLIAAGVVEDLPPKWLPRSMGDIEVRLINPNPQPGEHPYGLMWWRDALALLEDGGG